MLLLNFLFLKNTTFATVVYTFIVLALQATSNWFITLNPLTKFGIILFLSSWGGLTSFYRELHQKKKSNLLAHVASANTSGLIVGLITHDYFNSNGETSFIWLGIILIVAVFNNMFLKKLEDIVENRMNYYRDKSDLGKK
jgi:hypothetical protein